MCIIIESYPEAGLLVFWISPAYLVNLLSDGKNLCYKDSYIFQGFILILCDVESAVMTVLFEYMTYLSHK